MDIHFKYLASPACFKNISFETLEENYDYGLMITPWNHFHLSWIAKRLGNLTASIAHAKRLCSTTVIGDERTGRFINRLATWQIFDEIRTQSDIKELLDSARDRLDLVAIDDIPAVRTRLNQIWTYLKPEIEEFWYP